MKKLLIFLAVLALALLTLPLAPKNAKEAWAPELPQPRRAPASAVPAPRASRTMPAATLPEIPRLAELRACYDQDCGFGHGDPREYDHAVGQALKAALLSLAEKARANHLRDPRIAEAARKQLETENGHVQEAALAVLATQDPSPEARDGILKHVIDGYDAEVIPRALQELARYGGADDQEQIAAALSRAIVTGSPFVAKAIAAKVTPFVTSATAPTFRDALQSLPDNSIVKEDLQNALAH